MHLSARHTPKELADFFWHHTALPGTVRLALLMVVCLSAYLSAGLSAGLSAWLDPTPQSPSTAGNRTPAIATNAQAATHSLRANSAASWVANDRDLLSRGVVVELTPTPAACPVHGPWALTCGHARHHCKAL